MDVEPIEKVLHRSGWAYYKDAHGLHHALRSIEPGGEVVEHTSISEAELLRRVWRYEDWKGL